MTAAGRARPGPRPATREALIRAALAAFAERGFEAASTRDIARAARTNVASIAYHFGGKEGLREACARHVVDTLTGVASVLAAEAPAVDLGPAEAGRRLEAAISRMVGFLLLEPDARLIAGFVLGEMRAPSPALDVIYRGLFAPVHGALCRLWSAATGDAEDSDETRVRAFALIGQTVYFRIAEEVVRRRLGRPALAAAEAELIAGVLAANVADLVRARRSGKP